MFEPLKKCCNGCDAPPHAPSKVLCRECFAALDAKMHALGTRKPEPPPNRELRGGDVKAARRGGRT